MASKLCVTVEGVSPEQAGALYQRLVSACGAAPSPDIEIVVNQMWTGQDPVQTPGAEVQAGLDGQPVRSLPTRSG